MNRAEKREVRLVLKGAIAAAGELMAELGQKRAAKWDVVNMGLYNAEQKVRELAEKR